MTAAWPADLPQFVLAGKYTEQVETGSISSERPLGDPLVRVRSQIDSQITNAAVMLSTEQVTSLEQFYRSTLVDGTKPFTFADPRLHADRLFEFTAPPSMRAVSHDLFEASISLRRLPS